MSIQLSSTSSTRKKNVPPFTRNRVCHARRPRTSSTPSTSMLARPTLSGPNFTSYVRRSPTIRFLEGRVESACAATDGDASATASAGVITRIVAKSAMWASERMDIFVDGIRVTYRRELQYGLTAPGLPGSAWVGSSGVSELHRERDIWDPREHCVFARDVPEREV